MRDRFWRVPGRWASRDPPGVTRSSRLRSALLCLALALALALAGIVAGCSDVPRQLATLHIDPTPTPTPKPPTAGELAAKAFYDRVQGGKLTYHASLNGNVAGAISGLSVQGSIDVAGDDYSEDVIYAFITPPRIPVSVRAVGTRRWLRFDRGAWQKVSSAMASNNPFADLRAEDGVQFVRTEHVGGKDLHHISMTGGLIIAPDLIPAGNLTNERVIKTNLEVVVDDRGNPVSATWRLDGEARVSSQLQGIRIEVDLLFTNVGSKLTIKAP
jgi:hypothetical protein